MADITVDRALLESFEAGFDPRRPERSALPARALANGKGCTILALDDPAAADVVFKRMSFFRSEAEAVRYEAVLQDYISTLAEQAGVPVLPSTSVHIRGRSRRAWTVYIIQQRVPETAIGHHFIGHLPPAEVDHLVVAILAELAKVFDFNKAHAGKLELSIDGRISNWAVPGLALGTGALPNPLELRYLDVGTPLMMRDGLEQFTPEPLLRSFPLLLRPLLRRALLPDLMARYYNFRRVTLDLLSSILNAGYGNLLRMLVDSANWFFLAERLEMHFRPITVQEVYAYHRRDMRRWQAYLLLRRQRTEAMAA